MYTVSPHRIYTQLALGEHVHSSHRICTHLTLGEHYTFIAQGICTHLSITKYVYI